jgi:hypothetical protein
LSDDRPNIKGALRSDWAFSTLLMALTMLMPMLGIFGRAQDSMPGSAVWIWVVASIVPGIAGLGFFVLLSQLTLRLLPTRPAFLALTVWFATGLMVAFVAIAVRLQIPGSIPALPYNSFLLVTVTVGTMALLTVGRFRLYFQDDQLRQAIRQERRLEIAQLEEVQSGLEKLQALAREVESVITPEITRLEGEIAELGENSSSEQLKELHDEILVYTATVVREKGRDLAVDTFRESRQEPLAAPGGKLRWRGPGGIWDMVLSAHLTLGVIAIGGIYFFARYSRAGCLDSLSLAVGGYLVVALVVYWISIFPPLRKRPWALILLVGGTTAGFVILQYVLAQNADCVPEYPMASQVIDFVVSLTVLIALIVLFEAGRRAQVNTESIARTNENLAESTMRIQRSNAVTRSKMAQILHGGVQGRLSSISLALRRYLDDEKSGVNVSLVDLKKRLEFQLMEVRDELSQLTSSNTNTRVDIEVEFRKAVMQWRGLLVISQDIDPSAKSVLTSNDYLSWATSEVLTAAVTNSNLHGQAQNVWITVGINSAPDVSQLEIVIEDDGTGPPGNLIPGMGLGGIDALGGRWQLAPRTDGGCRLSVHLPIN